MTQFKHGMKAFRRVGLAASFVLSAAAMPAMAADVTPISMSASASAPELAIVNTIFGGFVSAHPGIVVKTAEVDLQGKGVASIVVRFESTLTCTLSNSCETAVLFYDQGSWRTVFEHSTHTLSLAPPAHDVGTDNMKSLVIDNHESWIWTGLNQYLPDVTSLGTPFPKPVAAAEQIGAAAYDALAATPKMAALLPQNSTITYTQSKLDLGSGSGEFYFVRAYAPGYCSDDLGCPHVILMAVKNGYAKLWTGLADGPGAVLPSQTNGLADIALVTRQGYDLLQFDGRSYQLKQTSYPSAVTPAP